MYMNLLEEAPVNILCTGDIFLKKHCFCQIQDVDDDDDDHDHDDDGI